MRTLLIFAIGTLAACSILKTPQHDEPSVRGTDERMFYGDTLEQTYDPHVMVKRGDAFFDAEAYQNAAEEYERFLNLHSSHRLASYVQFKLAESFFATITTIDRDTTPILRAHDAYEKLLAAWPDSPYTLEARIRIQRCRRLFAENVLFIGHFYFRRESYFAAAHRFADIAREYADIADLASEALYFEAVSYQMLGAEELAHEALQALQKTYPTSSFASDAHSTLLSSQ